MSRTFSLASPRAVTDLQTFLGRAGRIEDGSARLIAESGVLAVYIAILYPVGLHDSTPTVLGLRTFALTDGAAFDAVVPLRSLLDRLARLAGEADDGPVEIPLPLEVNTVVWTAISPPRGGWLALGELSASACTATATRGIEEIRETVPEGTGELLVTRVRAEVWGRGMPDAEHIPSGSALGGHVLGFFADDDPVRVFESGPWTRLTTRRGHVLVRRKGWTLLG